ncbi:ZKSCAN7 [Cordylochernes scorpioides]|uniref:ZKSCAN7 n=1 Tax=Cordylochernes scorpioides TaxID=51811 RepID=A0ABY6JV98_9ARAC|nr:ZKSCAN7 [Cordylochernes scorpioides]
MSEPCGRWWRCPICRKCYTHRSSIIRHKKTHQEVQELFTCNYCHKGFTQTSSLRVHTKRFHPAAEDIFPTWNN